MVSKPEPSPKVPAKAASKLAATQNSYDKTDDLEDVSQMRRNFNEAFEETEFSAPASGISAPASDRMI